MSLQDKNLAECFSLLRGDLGAKVRLELFNAEGKKTNVVELARQKFVTSNQFACRPECCQGSLDLQNGAPRIYGHGIELKAPLYADQPARAHRSHRDSCRLCSSRRPNVLVKRSDYGTPNPLATMKEGCPVACGHFMPHDSHQSSGYFQLKHRSEFARACTTSGLLRALSNYSKPGDYENGRSSNAFNCPSRGLGDCGVVVCVGCGKAQSNESSEKTAFEKAPPEVKQVWESALAADKANDYLKAQQSLDSLGQMTLSEEQKQALEKERAAFGQRVWQAAEKNDPAAVKAVQESQNSRRPASRQPTQ